MLSIHSVARQQHLKQERKEKMNNQITLKQLLLVATTEDISVYLKDVNCMDIERLIYSKDDNRNNLHPYLDYVVESVDENWSIVIRGQPNAKPVRSQKYAISRRGRKKERCGRKRKAAKKYDNLSKGSNFRFKRRTRRK